jgi:hypothetical protein
MLIQKTTYGYSRNKKHITGRGFVDTMSSVFNSLKSSVAPAFRSIGSYVSANRDLIAKPVLGALGSLAATGLSAGVPALISHISKRNTLKGNAPSQLADPKILDDPKYKEILESMMTSSSATPVTNIIGSGVKVQPRVRRRGAGIKTF